MRGTHLGRAVVIMVVSATLFGCSSRDSSSGAVAQDSSAGTSSASAPGSSSGVTAIRGRVTSVSDNMLMVASSSGEVHVALAQPVQVYTREPAELARVTEGSFVGVTSMQMPDGSQRATEIHIFPEELRGTNEGSFLMGQVGGGENRNRMTNGSVGASRMTNGAASRMTNGSVGGQAGGTLTVNYRGGSQTIMVPPGVTVTAITRTQAKLTPGTNVVVLAEKQPDGTLKASRVMLAAR
jgi:Domain of unknown function (DUF5666)